MHNGGWLRLESSILQQFPIKSSVICREYRGYWAEKPGLKRGKVTFRGQKRFSHKEMGTEDDVQGPHQFTHGLYQACNIIY